VQRGERYDYMIRANDYSGNKSTPSSSISAFIDR
jgi:hypothetical protein